MTLSYNKNKQVLFSKLICCLYQVTFFCMECPIKRRALFKKDMLEKYCAVVKSHWWHMEKIINIYWENYHVTQCEILCQVFKKK